MHEVLVNRLGGLSLPRKNVVRLTDRPDMTLDVYRGRKTTIQPTNRLLSHPITYAIVRVLQYIHRALDKRESLTVIRDNIFQFCIKTYVGTAHLNHLDETV